MPCAQCRQLHLGVWASAKERCDWGQSLEIMSATREGGKTVQEKVKITSIPVVLRERRKGYLTSPRGNWGPFSLCEGVREEQPTSHQATLTLSVVILTPFFKFHQDKLNMVASFFYKILSIFKWALRH